MNHLGHCWGQDMLPLRTSITAAGWGQWRLPLLLEQQGHGGTHCHTEQQGGHWECREQLSLLRC